MRYIVASRLTGSETPSRSSADRPFKAFMKTVGSVDKAAVAVEDDPARLRILEGTPRDFVARHAQFGDDLIVEQELQRLPGLVHPMAAPPVSQPPSPSGRGVTIELNLSSNGAPLEDALTILYLQSTRGAPPSASIATSDESGSVALPFDPTMWVPAGVSIMPRAAAWSVMTPITSQRVRLALPALPRNGPTAWWHRMFGIHTYDPNAGKGIRVGVIDTGIGPHPYLEHAERAGAFLNGMWDTSAGATDAVADHGTHVAGIIGARPTDLKDFAGIAPGADLVIARVYPGGGPPGMESGPTSNADIAHAILILAREKECDLINISSSGLMRSEVEANRINAAMAHGTLVICSVGNGGGPPVMFPAAEPAAIGVTALGLFHAVPAGVLDTTSIPPTRDRFGPGGIFSPVFASLGMEVKCAAPGVGIISTVPPFGQRKAPYVAMSGTSMAAPALAGALAALLSRDEKYKSLPRTIERSQRAGAILARSLRSLGMMIPYQGFGFPLTP